MRQEIANAIHGYLWEQEWNVNIAPWPIGASTPESYKVTFVILTTDGYIIPVDIDTADDEELLVVHTKEKSMGGSLRSCSYDIELANPKAFDLLDEYISCVKYGDIENEE